MRPARKDVMGKSVEGRELSIQVFQGSRVQGFKTIVVFGGFHGDEPKSVYVVERLIEELQARRRGNEARRQRRNADTITILPNYHITKSIRWVLMPSVNPDGHERRTRRNANKIDINRNFPTKNWEVGNPRSRMFSGFEPASEPETRAVIRVIDKYKPTAIITIHSINRSRFCNNFDGPGRELARRLSRHNKYPVTSTIGYPTPGSFGTWAGVERGIPTITLELPSHHSAKRCWEDNGNALLALGI
jgi:protein MpaA